jgi:hypothetical protein
MNLLMVALARNLRPFRDDGGSNSEIRSEGKSGDQEDSGKGVMKRIRERAVEFECHEPFTVPIQYGSESGHKSIPR